MKRMVDTTNYIDKLMIEKTSEKSNDNIQNNTYGTYFENSINTKSCVNLNIKSINDRNVFPKEYRHFSGLKLILVDDTFKSKNFITKLLDEGNYKVIPYSNYYYKITFNHKDFYISYNEKKLSVMDYYYKIMKKKSIDFHEQSIKNSFTSSNDIYLGTFYLFWLREIQLSLIILSSEAEIDGFFDVIDQINLALYKAPTVFSNFEDNYIKPNSLLLYEIKSGDKPEKLKNQILKRCNFIIKYLTFFYKKPIYYFGFYQSNIRQKYGLNTNIIINLKEKNENKETEEESTKNDEKNNFESSSNNNSINEDKKTKNDEEQNKQEVEKQNQNNNDKMNVVSEINDDDEKLERINVEQDFSSLTNLPANIMIFQLNGEIFGEKLIYEKEELNLLGNLREDVKDIKINIQNIIERQNKNEKILLAVAQKLNVNIDDIMKNDH